MYSLVSRYQYNINILPSPFFLGLANWKWGEYDHLFRRCRQEEPSDESQVWTDNHGTVDGWRTCLSDETGGAESFFFYLHPTASVCSPSSDSQTRITSIGLNPHGLISAPGFHGNSWVVYSGICWGDDANMLNLIVAKSSVILKEAECVWGDTGFKLWALFE